MENRPGAPNTRAEIAKLAPTSLALMIYMGISHLMPRGRYHANIWYYLRGQQIIRKFVCCYFYTQRKEDDYGHC